MKNKPWTQEELEYVRDCRERLKPVSYSDIAAALGRSAGVCQLKYHYYFGDHKRNDEMLPANITICWLCKHTNRYDSHGLMPTIPGLWTVGPPKRRLRRALTPVAASTIM